ncbi:MAG: ABC transporter permease [Lachnospiraceae bacterium]
MSFIQRAFLHTTRKIGKSLLIFFVLLIISTLVLTCLSIRSATETAVLNVRQSLGGSYTLNAKGTDGQLTDTILEQIAKIDGVERIDNARSESYAEYKTADGTPLEVKKDASFDDMTEGFEHAGKLQSNLYSEKDELFVNEGFELLEGRHITKGDENVALIHEEFAERNRLSIGDTFALDLNGDMVETPDYVSTPVEVKIIGIFTHTTEQETALNVSYTLYENTVFTDPASFTQLFDNGKDTYYSNAEIVVNDPAMLDAIVAEMETLDGVDWDACNVTYHDTDYQNAKEPLEALGNLVSISIVIIIIVSVALLVLILALWVRNRLHETGVFLSMGVSKANVLLQHITEIILVAVLAFALSFPISSVIAQKVGDTLLEQTTPSVTETVGNESADETDNAVSNLTNLDVEVAPFYLLLVYGMGTLAIVLSVSIAAVPIMKMKPKEILSTIS